MSEVETMAAWAEPAPLDPLAVLRRVFEMTPCSVARQDHDPEGMWAALGYDVHDSFTDDEDMESFRAECADVLRDVNRLLGTSFPLPPRVEEDE